MGASSFSDKDIIIYLNDKQYKAGLKNVIFDAHDYFGYNEENDEYDYGDNFILDDINSLITKENNIFNKEYLPSKQAIRQTQRELLNLYGTRYSYVNALKEFSFDR
ncbi:hypothetical protein [[Mycoplasma] gypis]|uniref:Uncharacterized protein n=1 Tax=[Mycoplasma] gypis TaxID=92404 RepID=A0ABZ2RUX8_9BACT|nr:hypothetical protein [[Mycoplasma] gypis]MBN0919394.1 hypothetical protein [[Mycoplasma] gypis]